MLTFGNLTLLIMQILRPLQLVVLAAEVKRVWDFEITYNNSDADDDDDDDLLVASANTNSFCLQIW